MDVDGFADLGFLLGSVVLAVGLGVLVFWIVRGARWALMRADKSGEVSDPAGRLWTVRIPLAPPILRLPVSKRLFRMRRVDQQNRVARGDSPDGVRTASWRHGLEFLGNFEELGGVLAVAGLVIALLVVLAAVAVFLVEALAVVLLAVLIGAARAAFGRWQCEVVDPDGQRTGISVGSLADARLKREMISDSIASGRPIDLFLG